MKKIIFQIKPYIFRKRLFYITTIFFFLLNSGLKAQEISKPKIIVPNHGISLGLMGAIPIGFSFDSRLSNKISFEFSLGAGYSGGLKYFIFDPTKHRFNLFAGTFYTSTELTLTTDSSGVTSESIGINGNSLYIPLGLSYNGRKNLQYSVEAGAIITKNNLSPMIGLKIGYRFSVDYEEIKNTEKTPKRNVLSGSIFGITPLIGVVYERLLTPYFSFEVGIGLPSLGAGLKLYAPQIRDDKWNFHFGASHYFFVFPWAGGWKTYFPIGINRMSKGGFRISFDLGPNISWYENFGSEFNLLFNGNLRIGKAF